MLFRISLCVIRRYDLGNRSALRKTKLALSSLPMMAACVGGLFSLPQLASETTDHAADHAIFRISSNLWRAGWGALKTEDLLNGPVHN